MVSGLAHYIDFLLKLWYYLLMINKNIVIEKLNNIIKYNKELESILKLDSRFLIDDENYRDLRALEREFQLIVDSMIEINSHFIKKLNFESAEDYTNTFIILGKNNILPQEFSVKIAKVVGLRNKIVHSYDIIDQKKFIDDWREARSQFIE